MLWVPKKGKLRRQTNASGGVGTSTPGTTVQASGTASVKGTPAQLIASTSFDAYWVRIMACNVGLATAASAACLDILVGTATEEVLIPNLLAGYAGRFSSAGTGPKVWDFPLYIPAGTRIAAQIASERVSANTNITVFLYGGDGYPPWRVGQKVVTYGVAAVPNGTAVTPGASGAEGAWTEITSGTTEDHFAIVPSFQLSTDVSLQNRTLQLDVGLGAATEVEISEGYWYTHESNEFVSGPYNSMPIFQDIVSGSRLSARLSNDGTNDGPYEVAFHGVS